MTDENNYTIFSKDDLETIETYASLKYTLYEIALMMDADIVELRERMTNKADPVYRAYTAGKLKSEVVMRSKVLTKAEAGEEWAINMLEKWKIRQKEEELGCHE